MCVQMACAPENLRCAAYPPGIFCLLARRCSTISASKLDLGGIVLAILPVHCCSSAKAVQVSVTNGTAKPWVTFISLIYIAHYSSVCVVSRRNMILSGVLKPSAHSSLLALRVTGCLSVRSAGLLNDHIPTLCKC